MDVFFPTKKQGNVPTFFLQHTQKRQQQISQISWLRHCNASSRESGFAVLCRGSWTFWCFTVRCLWALKTWCDWDPVIACDNILVKTIAQNNVLEHIHWFSHVEYFNSHIRWGASMLKPYGAIHKDYFWSNNFTSLIVCASTKEDCNMGHSGLNSKLPRQHGEPKKKLDKQKHKVNTVQNDFYQPES